MERKRKSRTLPKSKRKQAHGPWNPVNTERDKQIRFLYGDGKGTESLESIGEIYGISRQRVWQIVRSK